MGLQGKPRIYLRRIQPLKDGLASEDTMIWIWMGTNPVGKDWNLGSVALTPLHRAIKAYTRRVCAAANHGAPLRGWLTGRRG